MAVRPVFIDRFGGLDLSADFFEIAAGRAVVARNVWVGDGATVARRHPASAGFTASAAIAGLHATSYQGQGRLLGNTAGRLLHWRNSVLTETLITNSAGGHWGFCDLPDDRVAVACRGSANVQLVRLSDAGFDTSIGGVAQGAEHVALTPWDERLVIANMPGSAEGSNARTVRFSEPTVYDSFPTDDFVDLAAGIAGITAMVTWQDKLFVFAEKRFYVFYGTSTDATGGAVFNWRPVDMDLGARGPANVCVGQDGVYFASRGGIYRTTGGRPERALRQLDALTDRLDFSLLDQLKLECRDGFMVVASDRSATSADDPELGEYVVWVCQENGDGLVQWDLTFGAAIALAAGTNGSLPTLWSVSDTDTTTRQVPLGPSRAAFANNTDSGELAPFVSEYVPGGALPGEPAGVRTIRRALLHSAADQTSEALEARVMARWYADGTRSALLAARELRPIADPETGRWGQAGLFIVDEATRGRRVRIGVDPGTDVLHAIELHLEAERPPGEGFAQLADGVPA